jgi:hypothetical protein
VDDWGKLLGDTAAVTALRLAERVLQLLPVAEQLEGRPVKGV